MRDMKQGSEELSSSATIRKNTRTASEFGCTGINNSLRSSKAMLTAATYILLAGQTEAQATGNTGKLASALNLQLRNETDL